MEVLAGLLIGGILLAFGIGVTRRRPDARAPSGSSGPTTVADSVAEFRRTEGINVNRHLEVALDWGAAGLAAGTAIGAAFGAAGGPVGAAIGAFVGAFVGLIKAAIDTEAYGTVVRDAIASYLRAGGQPTSSAHIDAMVFRDALLASGWVWYNARTGALGVEILELAHGRREHFHNLPYPPSTSLEDGEREGIIPGRAARSTKELIEGTNGGRLDGPDQRHARRVFWQAMRIGDVYPIEYSGGHSSWNDTGSYLVGPGFRRLWPHLGNRKLALNADWHRVTPAAANVDALAAAFDRAAGVSWRDAT